VAHPVEIDKVPDAGDVPVRAVLSPWPAFTTEGKSLTDAMDVMKRFQLGTLPVLARDGSYIGLVTRKDLLDTLRLDHRNSPPVEAVCRPNAHVDLNTTLRDATEMLDSEWVGRIAVVEGRELVGCVVREEIQEFQAMRQRFHEQYRVAELSPRERAKITWRLAQPDATWTTWGIKITGEAFIAKAASYGVFGPDRSILEVGPGYGRLLQECLRRKLPFRRYVAVDLSPANAEHLARQFDRPDVEIVNADIETVKLDERFDVMFSSLTLKHLYPSFEVALQNVQRHLNPGAAVVFDLIEGSFGSFTPADGVSYVRGYTREEVAQLLPEIGLELNAFDQVEHSPGQVRLLVVARKP
jgi:SAM-dependent methyltransferase